MPIRFMPQHGSKDKLLCLFDASSRIGVLSNEIAGHLGDCFSAIKPPENEVLDASGIGQLRSPLRKVLQSALNPAGDRRVERFGWTFGPGDKVMQIENDYEKDVYNGDIGYVDDVDPDAGELNVNFDGHSVTYGFGELDTLVPAYAATIHKSQGSEYPAVVIPIMTQHYAMLQRNLLYTGITRGKRLVVLVGQKKAIAIAVRNVSGRRRWSKLDEWFRPMVPAAPSVI